MISIGTTLTGRAIQINPLAQSKEEIALCFNHFDELDLFDALMAFEYLVLADKRASTNNLQWTKLLSEVQFYLSQKMERNSLTQFKIALDLTDAFKTRDYGKQRVYTYLRTL